MALTLKMTVHRSADPAADDSATESQTYQDEVWLQQDTTRFLTATGNVSVIDFVRRRLTELDAQAHTYVRSSLYAEVAFRHFESTSRQEVRQVVEAAGQVMPGFGAVHIEHQLSVRCAEPATTIADPPLPAPRKRVSGWIRSLIARSDIAVEQREGHLRYGTPSGRLLLQYAIDGFATEPELVRSFVRLLRIRYGGHPLILERMAASGRIPREIRYGSLDPMGASAEELTLRIHSVEPAEERPIVSDGYKRLVSPDKATAVDVALARALAAAAVDHAAVRARRLAEAQQALAAGRPVEAVLTICELGLENDAPKQELEEAMRSVVSEPAAPLLALISQLGAKRGEAEAKSGLAALVGFRQAAGRRAHVLNTFEAVCHSALGQVDEARARLLEALKVNPFLVGAYKDLGDLEQREYAMRRAWTCWEAARRLAPRHPMLNEVEALEKLLERTHPEFF